MSANQVNEHTLNMMPLCQCFDFAFQEREWDEDQWSFLLDMAEKKIYPPNSLSEFKEELKTVVCRWNLICLHLPKNSGNYKFHKKRPNVCGTLCEFYQKEFPDDKEAFRGIFME